MLKDINGNIHQKTLKNRTFFHICEENAGFNSYVFWRRSSIFFEYFLFLSLFYLSALSFLRYSLSHLLLKFYSAICFFYSSLSTFNLACIYYIYFPLETYSLFVYIWCYFISRIYLWHSSIYFRITSPTIVLSSLLLLMERNFCSLWVITVFFKLNFLAWTVLFSKQMVYFNSQIPLKQKNDKILFSWWSKKSFDFSSIGITFVSVSLGILRIGNRIGFQFSLCFIRGYAFP